MANKYPQLKPTIITVEFKKWNVGLSGACKFGILVLNHLV
jgi:hypothetical protein